MDICHQCDNPLCVRPDHLFLGDDRANLADMRSKGRGALPPWYGGRAHWKTSFTDDDIRTIRHLYADGHSLRTLGRQYRVSFTTISKIVRGRTWMHVS